MQGTLLDGTFRLVACRFIPAHAGNTSLACSFCTGLPVHPRACREHFCLLSSNNAHRGSSPRMQGTPAEPISEWCGHRFIPAHAGNTGIALAPPMAITVHPRACREHGTLHVELSDSEGSSPRMQGTLRTKPTVNHMPRFIPAHAGNTWG